MAQSLFASALPNDENRGLCLPTSQVLQLTENDFQVDFLRPLGEGAFCQVYPCYLKHPSSEKFTVGPVALKKLKDQVAQGWPKKANESISDLRFEAKVLSGLTHVNIIHLCGVSDSAKVDKLDTFLVLDMLNETLSSKLETWRKDKTKMTSMTSQATQMTRLKEIVFGIADGMEYLHQKHIMFRDLKPENVGFSKKDVPKLFDFGLCKKLAPGQRGYGRTGTIMYMAPEVGSKEGYYYPADVHSFAIVMWETLTTKIPFQAELTLSSDPSAAIKATRPPLKYIENKELRDLLQDCWTAKPEDRPTFSDIGMKARVIADTNVPLHKGSPKPKRMLRIRKLSR